MRRSVIRGLRFAGLAALCLPVFVLAESHPAASAEKTPQQQLTEQTTAWFNGRMEFMDHCAACHGADGKGHGPVAAVMSIRLPDLTGLTKRNGGEFPYEYVAKSIDGRKLPKSHGNLEMPIWGQRYSEGRNDRVGQIEVHAHIYELMVYVQSIQDEKGESRPPSSPLGR
jgi:mono/diheme cytochrome c family protein